MSGSLALLEPGDAVVLYLDGTLDGDLANTATATGVPPVGPDVTDDDTATVTVLVPGVTIDKSVYTGHDDGACCQGGESVVGRVRRRGDVVLPGDQHRRGPSGRHHGRPRLGLHATRSTTWLLATSITLRLEGTVDGDLPNTATVTGETPDGDEVEDEDEAEVDEIHPAIHVEKTVYAGHDDGAQCDGVEPWPAPRSARP